MFKKVHEFSVKILDRKIAWSTFVQYAGKLVQLGLASAAIKIIAMMLDQSGFGLYSSITEYVLFFSVVANLGIFGNLVRRMAVEPRNANLFYNAVILRIISGVIFFGIGMVYLLIVGAGVTFILASLIFFCALLFELITTVCDGMLQANYMMGRANVAVIAGRFLNLLVLLLAYKMNIHAIWMVLLASMIGSLATTFLSFYFVSSKLEKKALKFDKVLIKELLIAGLPFGIINVLNNLYFRFLPDFFAHQGTTDAQFATFSIAFRIAQVLSLISTFLMFSVLPGFKEYLANNDMVKFKVVYAQAKKVLLGIGILVILIGTGTGRLMLEILTHKKYFSSEFNLILPLMLVLTAISYGYDLVLITIFALEKEYWFMKREFVALGICLFIYLLFNVVVSGNYFGILSSANLVSLRYTFCLVGPILAESYMVICGLKKIKTMILQKKY